MKVRTFLLIGVLLLRMMSVSQAQEAAKVGQGQDSSSKPTIKSLFYGFDVLDIVRGLEGKIDFELSGTFTSKHIWHDLDLLDDHGAFIPVGTVIFGDSGFSAKIIDVYPLSSGFERSVERNYAGFYTGDLLEGTPWATSFTLNYFYFGKPKIPGHKNDAQEIGSTFYWPRLFALGDGYITPRYYVGHFGASKSNSNIRGCEGFIHVFGLGYDFEIPEFWPGGDKQAFRLSGDITYNDGYASAGSDMKGILDAAKQILGKNTKIFGGTSDSRAVMTNKGFVKVEKRGYTREAMEGLRGLAIMTVTSKDITFGVGSADLPEFSSPQEMSKAAILSAIESTGKTAEQTPTIVLLTSIIGIEEEVIEGIEEVIGRDALVLGGTVGGPDIAVFGEDAIYEKGVSLAVLYTDLPIGWTFEGGFDVTDKNSGIVTKVNGQNIVEIDNRPALDVYNQWLGGKIDELYEEGNEPGVIRDLLTLHPIYRKYTSRDGQDYFLFSHPWPKDDEMKDRSVSTSTKI